MEVGSGGGAGGEGSVSPRSQRASESRFCFSPKRRAVSEEGRFSQGEVVQDSKACMAWNRLEEGVGFVGMMSLCWTVSGGSGDESSCCPAGVVSSRGT